MSITKLNNLSISAVTALPSGVGGKVLQVVTATDSTSRSTTSSSYVTASNTLSASITPASASNKIFVMVTLSGYSTDQTFYTIFRGATNLGSATNDNAFVEFYIGADVRSSIAMSVLDSPSTTSSTTYQVYLKTNTTGRVNQNNTKGSITLFEIAG